MTLPTPAAVLANYANRYATPARIGALPKVEVFVDELGDRGFSAKASPTFSMTAVMVPAESIDHMRVVAAGLREVINTSKPLHWVEHFTPKPKHAHRRQLASDMVAALPGVKVIYVIADKATLVASTYLRDDHTRFYNYVTKLLLERVAFQARHWPGGPRMAITRMSSIRGTRERDSIDYLEAVRDLGRSKAPLQYIKWPPRWWGPERFDGLQIADLYTGMLGCALGGAVQDLACAGMLLAHQHQIRRGPQGKIFGYGIKVFGDDSVLTSRAWWPTLDTPRSP